MGFYGNATYYLPNGIAQDVVDGVITTKKLAKDAVTASKIAETAIHGLSTGNNLEKDKQGNSIDKLDEDKKNVIRPSHFAKQTITGEGHNKKKRIVNSQGEIVDSTTEKWPGDIALETITGGDSETKGNIAPNTIQQYNMADDSVGTDQIINGNITREKLDHTYWCGNEGKKLHIISGLNELLDALPYDLAFDGIPSMALIYIDNVNSENWGIEPVFSIGYYIGFRNYGKINLISYRGNQGANYEFAFNENKITSQIQHKIIQNNMADNSIGADQIIDGEITKNKLANSYLEYKYFKPENEEITFENLKKYLSSTSIKTNNILVSFKLTEKLNQLEIGNYFAIPCPLDGSYNGGQVFWHLTNLNTKQEWIWNVHGDIQELKNTDINIAEDAIKEQHVENRQIHGSGDDEYYPNYQHIAEKSIGTNDIADKAIKRNQINDWAVQKEHVAGHAIQGLASDDVFILSDGTKKSHIAPESIAGGENGDIAPDTITGYNIAPDTITGYNIAPDTIISDHIQSIDGSKITGYIPISQIQGDLEDSTIAFANNCIDTVHIKKDAVTIDKLNFEPQRKIFLGYLSTFDELQQKVLDQSNEAVNDNVILYCYCYNDLANEFNQSEVLYLEWSNFPTLGWKINNPYTQQQWFCSYKSSGMGKLQPLLISAEALPSVSITGNENGNIAEKTITNYNMADNSIYAQNIADKQIELKHLSSNFSINENNILPLSGGTFISFNLVSRTYFSSEKELADILQENWLEIFHDSWGYDGTPCRHTILQAYITPGSSLSALFNSATILYIIPAHLPINEINVVYMNPLSGETWRSSTIYWGSSTLNIQSNQPNNKTVTYGWDEFDYNTGQGIITLKNGITKILLEDNIENLNSSTNTINIRANFDFSPGDAFKLQIATPDKTRAVKFYNETQSEIYFTHEIHPYNSELETNVTTQTTHIAKGSSIGNLLSLSNADHEIECIRTGSGSIRMYMRTFKYL